jgi:hypothetical protein
MTEHTDEVVTELARDHGRSGRVDCAWCSEWFGGVLDLLAHVEECHLPPAEAA